MNKKWECYICSIADNFKNIPAGYLGNYHPICLKCADAIYYNNEHQDRFRLTYHVNLGDLLLFEKQLISMKNYKSN